MAAVLLTILFWFTCFLAQLGEQMTHSIGVRGENPFTLGKMEQAEQQKWKTAHDIARVPYLLLPKTAETTALIERWMVMPDGKALDDATIKAARKGSMGEGLSEHAEEDLKRNPSWLVIGSSLGFEVFILGIAAWMFCRRDF
jgi:hypothetical protein